ncbi:4f3383a9-ec38-4cb6-9b2f-60aec8e9b447 [Sclerotinia trifoliorum]|uniref:4f3383a9-ec38-4cb6-9b2f-60aec8e9b447 n=1 Tax=Sclerotinia trifoliorum TaxID=28548 RepID=A0A8H2VV28_9HELO|nr:4f3383a9-ec38-4cb6-9b2f-60aec8e9b447 [Sclerotinia trifoliorum]
MPPQLTRVSVDSLPADQRTCPICQETLGGREGGEPVKTECNHYFDRNCIQQWLDGDKSTCPVCRKEIRNTGGGLSDRLRNINRSVHRARERAIEEREQMAQAQADYGGANDYPSSDANGGDSDDEPHLWMEYEPMSPSSPGNFNTPRPAPRNDPPPPPRRSYSTPPRRNYSPPRQRYQESRPSISDSNMERVVNNYSSTLNYIERLDHNIISQAQRSYHANERHHAAERQIQAAFTQLRAAAESRDFYAIEHALVMQDSVTPLLNEAYAVLQREGLPLVEMIEQRERADERLTRAREDFAAVRDRFMMRVRDAVDVGRRGGGGAREMGRERARRPERRQEYWQKNDDEDEWEPYDPAAWQGIE